MGLLRKALLLTVTLCICATAWADTSRAGASMSPAQLRALFLQRIVKYVHWPQGAEPAPGQPFIIAAADPEPLRPWFRNADPARFRLVAWPAPNCHVLYLNADNPREIAAVLRRTGNLPMLTVGENAGFADLGGIISFVPSGNRLRLLASPAAAARAGLGLSARLLDLAIVREADRLSRADIVAAPARPARGAP